MANPLKERKHYYVVNVDSGLCLGVTDQLNRVGAFYGPGQDISMMSSAIAIMLRDIDTLKTKSDQDGDRSWADSIRWRVEFEQDGLLSLVNVNSGLKLCSMLTPPDYEVALPYATQENGSALETGSVVCWTLEETGSGPSPLPDGGDAEVPYFRLLVRNGSCLFVSADHGTYFDTVSIGTQGASSGGSEQWVFVEDGLEDSSSTVSISTDVDLSDESNSIFDFLGSMGEAILSDAPGGSVLSAGLDYFLSWVSGADTSVYKALYNAFVETMEELLSEAFENFYMDQVKAVIELAQSCVQRYESDMRVSVDGAKCTPSELQYLYDYSNDGAEAADTYLTQAYGMLKENTDYAKAGLSTLLYIAQLHVSILQECCEMFDEFDESDRDKVEEAGKTQAGMMSWLVTCLGNYISYLDTYYYGDSDDVVGVLTERVACVYKKDSITMDSSKSNSQVHNDGLDETSRLGVEALGEHVGLTLCIDLGDVDLIRSQWLQLYDDLCDELGLDTSLQGSEASHLPKRRLRERRRGLSSRRS